MIGLPAFGNARIILDLPHDRIWVAHEGITPLQCSDTAYGIATIVL